MISDMEKQKWIENELPSDDYSIENAILVMKSKQYPLMIDPQCQALNWIQRQMGLKDNVNVFDNVQDKSCLRCIEKAIQFGNIILIKDISDEIDTIFTPLITKS